MPATSPTTTNGLPDMKVSVRQLFGINSDLEVPAFSQANDHVPDFDPDYQFNRETTLAILAGFAHNRRVMIQGYHGTGKSTHIEQVAARLNWPCIRINLDSHISRIDLIGKDAIVLVVANRRNAGCGRMTFDWSSSVRRPDTSSTR